MWSRHANGDVELRLIDRKRFKIYLQWIRTKNDRALMRVLHSAAAHRLGGVGLVATGHFFIGPVRVVWTKWAM